MNIDLVFKEIAHLNGVTPDQMKRKGRRMEVIKSVCYVAILETILA